MNSVQATVSRQIENYLDDSCPTSFTQNNNEWVPLESILRFTHLGAYSYETVVEVLRALPSPSFEMSPFQPICLRRRPHSSRRGSRTVLINGLPIDSTQNELFEFFQTYYPLDQLQLLPSAENFDGTVQLTFQLDGDAEQFVENANNEQIVYMKNHSSRFFTEHRLTCRLLSSCPSRERRTPSFFAGKSFSTRLSRSSTRLSSLSNESPKGDKADDCVTVPSPTQSSISSQTCVTEQILACQNLPPMLIPRFDHPKVLPALIRKFNYEFYVPDHLFYQIHPCVIISLLNPHCFTIQLEEDVLEFDKFQGEMNRFYNTTDHAELLVRAEQIDLNLCVMCADRNRAETQPVWNRSQILDLNPADETVNLFYVDLGTWEENVPFHRLRHLLAAFHRPLVFSLTCRLANAAPKIGPDDLTTGWSDQATQSFQNVIENVHPRVEFLSRDGDGCFRVYLLVSMDGDEVNLSNYLAHIGQANLVDDQAASDESTVHPVVALYHNSGETAQQVLQPESCATSSCSSSLSSLSLLPRSHVKVIPISLTTNGFSQRLIMNQPLIFVLYDKSILIPDFNVGFFLQSISPTYSRNTIEEYAAFKGFQGRNIHSHSDYEIFSQLTPLMTTPPPAHLVLYTLDFVRDILSHYEFSAMSLYSALDEAKRVQIRSSDLLQWFLKDNDLTVHREFSNRRASFSPHGSTATTPASTSSIPTRSIANFSDEDRHPTPPIDPPPGTHFRFSNRLF